MIRQMSSTIGSIMEWDLCWWQNQKGAMESFLRGTRSLHSGMQQQGDQGHALKILYKE